MEMREREAPRLDFLIVGTPRSGTTLVQRLTCEIAGVIVPPETHFFVHFYPKLLSASDFPLSATQLRMALRAYSSLPTSQGLHVDEDAVGALLKWRCNGPADLFSALVCSLSNAEQRIGEKTPDHLRWWEPLTSALSNLKLIDVVRDPRAVVASNLEVPWGMDSHVALAEKWLLDRHEMLRAKRELGPDKYLQVRYEDVVARPDVARRRIADFLDIGYDTAAPTGVKTHHEWEQAWKRGALEPVTTARVAAWRSSLPDSQVTQINAICRKEMRPLGYGPERNSLPAFALLAFRPRLNAQRVRLRRVRRRQMKAIRNENLHGIRSVPKPEDLPC